MPTSNEPCVDCFDEADYRCFVCGVWVCRDHSATCIECGSALCKVDAIRVDVGGGDTEDFCPGCGRRAKRQKEAA